MNKIIFAMACVTILELAALLKGVNGTLLTIVVATLAGLGGLATKTPKVLKRLG